MKKKFLTVLTLTAIMASTPSTAYAAEWILDSTGYWYQNDDGSYPASTWQSINGYWYYFLPSGYMATGWIKVSNQWYYLEASGEMRTADLITDVFTFRFNSDGSCINFYENTTPSAQAGWASYGTTSLSTWANAISEGKIVYYNGQYWASPDYKNLAKTEEVVYEHDIAKDATKSNNNRHWIVDFKILNDNTNNNSQDLDGIISPEQLIELYK